MATTNQSVNSLVPGGTNTQQTPLNTNPAVFGANNPYMTAPMPGSPSANPYASTVPGSAVPGGTAMPYSSATIPTPNIGTPPTNLLNQELTSVYGGLGPTISSLLSSGGGYNPQVIQALLAQMQPGIQQGQQNLMEQFGAAGNRFSSSAATGLANYNSQVQLNEGDIMAQLYEQSYQNYMNEVMGISGQVSQYETQKPTGWDIASGILGMGTGLLGAIKPGGL